MIEHPVILITGTILVYQQVQYMRRQQLGMNIDQTLIIRRDRWRWGQTGKFTLDEFGLTHNQDPP